MEILQELYDSEINFSIECFWDAGFYVRLGDEVNGYIDSNFYALADAVEWLKARAIQDYPDSDFSQKHKAVSDGG